MGFAQLTTIPIGRKCGCIDMAVNNPQISLIATNGYQNLQQIPNTPVANALLNAIQLSRLPIANNVQLTPTSVPICQERTAVSVTPNLQAINLGNFGNLANIANIGTLANMANIGTLPNIANVGSLANIANIGSMSNVGLQFLPNTGNLLEITSTTLLERAKRVCKQAAHNWKLINSHSNKKRFTRNMPLQRRVIPKPLMYGGPHYLDVKCYLNIKENVTTDIEEIQTEKKNNKFKLLHRINKNEEVVTDYDLNDEIEITYECDDFDEFYEDVLGICEEIEFIPEGEIIVTGDDVIFDGVTEVEGNVPMTGNVVFEGPVRASGTVTIVGTSQPMLPPFGLGQSVGTPMVMPNYYIPYHLLPNTWYAPDMTLGYGNIESCGEDLSVIGETLLEGTLPIEGNVTFDGEVPAYDMTLGYGNIESCGEDLSVIGETLLEGTLPIEGNVTFDGEVPVYGKVIATQMVPYPMTGGSGIGAGSSLPALIGSGPMAGLGLQSSTSPTNGYAYTPNMAGSYMSNQNLANAVNAATNLANMELAAGIAAQANSPANTANVNAVKTANALLAAENAAVVNDALSNLEEAKQLSNLAPVLNGNMATFYLGNSGNGFTVTSGSPGTQGIGVQVLADALEVGGTVVVNGKIPIYGMVGINGNIPTDGMASVSYSCANPSTLL
ncbi:hypothetical protein RR48_10111 [Papilio machaon]|uniref:Uncharacterized protein n=2 Tax=Papilio machaon TaxID=76193 RepID=A0A194R4Z0_PAPMA|nr:hypothetical protein RR48_10111 [Papilio machaon]